MAPLPPAGSIGEPPATPGPDTEKAGGLPTQGARPAFVHYPGLGGRGLPCPASHHGRSGMGRQAVLRRRTFEYEGGMRGAFLSAAAHFPDPIDHAHARGCLRPTGDDFMRSTLDHERERHLRREQTEAERALWWRLRNRRLLGWKFRRQHRIGPYFADFFCLEAGLVIELDGSQHLEQIKNDASRTSYLLHAGFDVLRFWNDQVLHDTEAVLIAITIALAPHPPSAPSLRWHGEKEAPKRLNASPTTAASARRSG